MKDLIIERPSSRPAASGRTADSGASPQATACPDKPDMALALAALANTNEGMRHRAHDCKLGDISDLTRLLGVQLARVRSGALALSATRIDSLQFASSLIADLLDAQFEGDAPPPCCA